MALLGTTDPELATLLGLDPEKIRQQQQQAGLLSAGLAMLAASGPSRTPTSVGQIVAQGGMAGLQAYGQAGQQAVEQGVQRLRVGELKTAIEDRQKAREASDRFRQRMSDISGGVVTPSMALAGGGGPTQQAAAQIGKPINVAQEQQLAATELLGQIAPEELAKLAFREPRQTQGMLGQFREALRGGEIPPGTTFESFMRMVEKPPATVQIMPAESATQTGYAKFGVERNTAIFDAGQAAIRNLPKIDQTINLIKEGDAKTGFGAEVINNINRVRSAFTGSKKQIQSVSDTELLDSLLGSEVFPQIGALGIGAKGLDTPAEREFLRKVMTGTITMDKQTLIRMAELRRKYEKRSLDTYNDAVDSGQLDQLFRYSGLPKRKLQVPLQVNY